ncbi:hypothetical protein PRIC2_013760 [Phytophthora ramorum]
MVTTPTDMRATGGAGRTDFASTLPLPLVLISIFELCIAPANHRKEDAGMEEIVKLLLVSEALVGLHTFRTKSSGTLENDFTESPSCPGRHLSTQFTLSARQTTAMTAANRHRQSEPAGAFESIQWHCSPSCVDPTAPSGRR